MAAKTLYTVVVADDEDELREAVCTMIPWQDYGFCLVGSASNGLDALQLVEKHAPDLLLTDIRMPFISGIELARQVREVRPATNIAFLSGYDDFEYAKQAIQYNIISYMLKPLTMEGLGAELRTIREKIEAQYAFFRQTAPRAGAPDLQAAMLMPLVLDEFAEPEETGQWEAYARQCGLLQDGEDRPRYTVMVSSLLREDGGSGTQPTFAASVDRLARKYLRSVSDLHSAYREAMEALRQGDRTEGGAQFIGDLTPAARRGSLLCRRALEALDLRYMEADLSLVSLSTMLAVSPNHLSACIKKYTGETFINILIRKRMEAARELLASSALKVQEVAQRCGYTDQHYFSYCFKKYCGESPNALRRRLEQERAGDGA